KSRTSLFGDQPASLPLGFASQTVEEGGKLFQRELFGPEPRRQRAWQSLGCTRQRLFHPLARVSTPKVKVIEQALAFLREAGLHKLEKPLTSVAIPFRKTGRDEELHQR